MDTIFGEDLSSELERAERALVASLDAVLDPWILAQLALIALILVASAAAGRRIEQALEPKVREVHGRPRLLRVLALLLRRTRWIVATLALALMVLVMRAATLPSRGTLIGVAAALVAAWVAISVASRLIRNPAVGRLVAGLAWLFVALHITGIFDEVSSVLDAAAVRVGAVRISLWLLLQAIVLIGVLAWAAIMLGNLAERRIGEVSDLTPSLRVLFGKLVKIALLVAAGAIALTMLGIDLTALTFFSGALGLGIGFGLQKVVSNFVSGIIILLDKSIKPGDTIAIGETFGWVRSLRARFVSIITRDGREYLIPNEDFITQRVENWSFSDPDVRIDVEFGVAHDSDPHAVRLIAVEAAKTLDRVLERPAPVCHMTRIGESSLDFILRFWIADPQNGVTNVRGAVLLACWDALKAAGIRIPYPHRQIVIERMPARAAKESLSVTKGD